MRVRMDLESESLDYSKDGRVVGIEILREASQGVDRDEVERGDERGDMQAIVRI